MSAASSLSSGLRPNEAPSAPRHAAPPPPPTRVRDRGDLAATIQPLIPPDYQPLTSITASGKQCIKRPQQGDEKSLTVQEWSVRRGERGGREGERREET